VGTELKFAVALVLIIAVLLVRPAGLFGYPIATRV
jgi:branched-subunit amino acid ABC-type transport system permease component